MNNLPPPPRPSNNNYNNIAGNSLSPSVYALYSHGKYYYVNPRTLADLIQLKNRNNMNNNTIINKINTILANTTNENFPEIQIGRAHV